MFFLFMKPDDLQYHSELDPLERALDKICAVDPSMPASMILTLLRVARHGHELAAGETNLREVAASTKLPYSTFLRQIDSLGDGAPRVRGLKLLEKGFNGADRRARAVRLTHAGKKLLQELSQIFTKPIASGKNSGNFRISRNRQIPENQDRT